MSSNDNSLARTGSNYSTKSGAAAVRSNNLARMATENSAAALMGKPKLIRQTAILADGDSTGSGKSVTFQEPPGIGSARRFVAAAAEVGTCPLHSHERYKALYEKLVETAKAQAAAAEEESDMEASDVEDEVPNVNSDSLPLGTTFRTIHIVQPPPPNPTQPSSTSGISGRPNFIPRKLSTISSQDRESIPNIEEEEADDEAVEATTEAEVHAKLLSQSSGDEPPTATSTTAHSAKPPHSECYLLPIYFSNIVALDYRSQQKKRIFVFFAFYNFFVFRQKNAGAKINFLSNLLNFLRKIHFLLVF